MIFWEPVDSTIESSVQTSYKDADGLTSNVHFDDVIVFHAPGLSLVS